MASERISAALAGNDPSSGSTQPPRPLKDWISASGVQHLQAIVLGAPAPLSCSLLAADDPVVAKVHAGRASYAKHLLHRVDERGFTFRPTTRGWTVGVGAAQHGMEYRAFFEPGPTAPQKIYGAVRFSPDACADADGVDKYVHGGAIQTILDEVAGQCAMIKVCVLPAMVEATFKMMKRVSPDVTYIFESEVVEELVKGLKYKLLSALIDPATNTPIATCNGIIANIGAIPEARKSRFGE
ncbi:hypothetical protein AB1Y20_018672 [Prymnesium parvum]|uniref:Uncharacterized protein n=1 Tax=Prymnesium parvum TaxID=97485 RepID=A0AB34JPS5_PRYPA